MKIGIVCPYSFDVPGGVQFHIRDLAEHLISMGHEVSVLAPASEGTEIPEYMTATGAAIPITYNGSVARLAFGLRVNRKVSDWLAAHDFDVLHVHEPMVPSLSMLAVMAAKNVPIVATFHTSMEKSVALWVASRWIGPVVQKITGRIAVSAEARRTLVQHLGGDPIIIPNGVYVSHYQGIAPRAQWQGSSEAPTFAFLGRIDEARKGLPIFLTAAEDILAERPGARFYIAGRGEDERANELAARYPDNIILLGSISEEEKIALFASVDAYVAPQTGGESFGIVLVEAMSAGALVIASDIPAFRAVLADGRRGVHFHQGDGHHLARVALDTLADRERIAEIKAVADVEVWQYDWSTVSNKVLAVYSAVLSAYSAARTTGAPSTWLTRWGNTRADKGEEQS